MNATSAIIAARQAVSFDSEYIPCKIDPILNSTHYSGEDIRHYVVHYSVNESLMFTQYSLLEVSECLLLTHCTKFF